jgi:hypothetical protein
MAVRNAGRLVLNTWRGLNTYTPKESIGPESWFDSNNVLVNGKGEAEVLRSPNAFGNPVTPFDDSDSSSSSASSSPSSSSSEDLPMYGLSEYQRVAGNALIIDRGDDTYYLLAAAGTPTPIRSDQSGNPWTSVVVNDRYQRIDGTEFIQFMSNFAYYRNGIDGPAAAPTIAYDTESSESSPVSESSDENIAVSLQGSYAYMNSTTGHVSIPSPLSNVLGPSAGDNAVSFTVVASTQPGVDKIVFFLTVDGGSVPYLVIDCDDGDPHLENNASTTYTLVLSDVDRDTLTPEPIYNNVPPTDGTYMFEHQDRIILFVDGGIRYSGFESTYIGNGYESWPVLNQLNVPNRADQAVGGVSTQTGAVIFGKKDSYLLSGYPSDKASSPANALAVTEHLVPLKWKLGITYPETAVNTPFGIIWVDQTKRVRNWNGTGFPIEIAQALRKSLDAMTGPMKARWYQHGKNGGYYVLTDGTVTLFVMLYLSSETGQLQFGYGKSSSFTPESISSATFSGVERFFFGRDDQVYEILDPDLAGDGWTEDDEIFFRIMLGNDGNFSKIHSMSIEGGLNGLVVSHGGSNKDTLLPVDPEAIYLSEDLDADTAGAQFGIVDSVERRRHIVSFVFDIDDTQYRNIDGVVFFQQNSKRVI